MFRSNKSVSILALLLLTISGFGVYAGSMDVPYYLDDFRNISENSHIHIDTLSPGRLYEAAFASPLVARPVANVSFAFNYFLHRDRVFGYHLVNTAIHVATAFFLYLLFSFTLTSPSLEGQYSSPHFLSLVASLLWLVHPLHTGSVTYIVQRMVLLAGMFYVLSLLCFVRGRLASSGGRKGCWMACSVVAAGLALGSKEIAVTLPFAILLYDWYFFDDLGRRRGWQKLLIAALFLLAVAACWAIYTGNFTTFLEGYDNRPFTPAERMYTELRVVVYYLGLLLYPHPGRLNIDHSFPLSHSLVDPVSTLASGGAILVMLLGAVLVAKKERVVSFALLWYLGNLVLESSFLGLELVFEHRTYLPSMFLLLASVALVLRYVRPKPFAISLLAAALIVFASWTVERNRIWRDPVLFWSDSIAKSPEKARPYMNLSVALREEGNFDGAIAASIKAISIDPGFVNGFVGLGAAYAEKGAFDMAVKAYGEALERMPDYAEVYNALGIVYMRQGRAAKAVRAFNECLRRDPANINALVNRASALSHLGELTRAIADFRKALEAGGRHPDILFNLAVAYERNGEAGKAVSVYEKVLQIDPDDHQARENLAELRSRMAK